MAVWNWNKILLHESVTRKTSKHCQTSCWIKKKISNIRSSCEQKTRVCVPFGKMRHQNWNTTCDWFSGMFDRTRRISIVLFAVRIFMKQRNCARVFEIQNGFWAYLAISLVLSQSHFVFIFHHITLRLETTLFSVTFGRLFWKYKNCVQGSGHWLGISPMTVLEKTKIKLIFHQQYKFIRDQNWARGISMDNQ